MHAPVVIPSRPDTPDLFRAEKTGCVAMQKKNCHTRPRKGGMYIRDMFLRISIFGAGCNSLPAVIRPGYAVSGPAGPRAFLLFQADMHDPVGFRNRRLQSGW